MTNPLIQETKEISISNESPLHVHESNGVVYLSYPVQYKCKICGEFYHQITLWKH